MISDKKQAKLIALGVKYGILTDFLAIDFAFLEERVIEIEAEISHLTDEAKALGIEYEFDSDPEELESHIEQTYGEEYTHKSQLLRDYYDSRL